eukprot:4922661-Amphidinium_carterae.3
MVLGNHCGSLEVPGGPWRAQWMGRGLPLRPLRKLQNGLKISPQNRAGVLRVDASGNAVAAGC